MPRVTVDLWMWLSRELDREFATPSPMRSILEASVDAGTTARELFDGIADRHPAIRREVYNGSRFESGLVLALNNSHINAVALLDRVLEDGDSIMVLSMYSGG